MPSRGEEIFSFRHLRISQWHWRCKLRKADKASGRTPLYMNPSCKAILRIFIVQYQCGNESISELRSPSGEREVKSVRHIFCEVLVLMKRNLGPGYEVSLSLRKVGCGNHADGNLGKPAYIQHVNCSLVASSLSDTEMPR